MYNGSILTNKKGETERRRNLSSTFDLRSCEKGASKQCLYIASDILKAPKAKQFLK